MLNQMTAAAPHSELVQLMLTNQREIMERLERMERAQALSLTKEAYTTEEAAERLGRSEWTVRQWCNKGQVKGAYKVRGKGRTGEWRLPHDAVQVLVTQGPALPGSHPLTN